MGVYSLIPMHKVIPGHAEVKDLHLILLRQPFCKHRFATWLSFLPGRAAPPQVDPTQPSVSKETVMTLKLAVPLLSQQAATAAHVHSWLVQG